MKAMDAVGQSADIVSGCMSQARVERSARVALSPVPGGVGEGDGCDVPIGVNLRVLGGDIGSDREVPLGVRRQYRDRLQGRPRRQRGPAEPLTGSDTGTRARRAIEHRDAAHTSGHLGPDGLIHQPGRSP